MRRAIEFDGPDRAPAHHYVFPGAYWRHGQALVDLLSEYPDDFDNINISVPEPEPAGASMEIVEYRDSWGTLWRRMKGYTSGAFVEAAIPTWDNWGDYDFPPLPGPSHYEEFKRSVDEKHPQWYVYCGGGSLFQMIQHLRGPVEVLIDLAEDRREIHELVDRLVDYHIANLKGYLRARPDAVYFGDDWGTQEALFTSPEMWRRFFKPRYRRMFDVARDAGAHVWFHTDGWTLEILEDLVEIGVNVLNPQHHIMGTEKVGGLVGGKVCIRTDLDRQGIIPHGTPEEIVGHVKGAIAAFGRFNGGIILHGEVGPDVPLENIRTMYSAFRRYGQYPLTWVDG